ncbi:hypothetical protein MOQ_000505 [Trypanosoma cruzi marinkellei]|uniref:Uncharacterized protein n=1 Tax=Trypanosoma cruzi marinkellei TaxID=85056 RepID=K2NW45_TRYCR|nr:hypothetical protein MOQ_000505 [Trypanosoma cruzi marinkellei]
MLLAYLKLLFFFLIIIIIIINFKLFCILFLLTTAIGREMMSTPTNLAFTGYDVERREVLLKDALGMLYHLHPTWKRIEVATESIQSKGNNNNDDDDDWDEESFTETYCTDSYVSSASICTSSENGGSGFIENGFAKVNVREGETACDCKASCENDLESAVAPVHGTVLTLKGPYTREEELLSTCFLGTEITAGDLEKYKTVVVLGYNEKGDVFLLPMPSLVLKEGVYVYHCLPALQLDLRKFYRYYDWVKNTEDSLHRDTVPLQLPLGEEFMNCPQLDRDSLRHVYDVFADRVYYLSAWSAQVEFVGVAWGVPWVKVIAMEGETGGTSPVSGELNNFCSYIKPLHSCHEKRQLYEAYGLCESGQILEKPGTLTSSVPPAAELMEKDENLGGVRSHIEKAFEDSPDSNSNLGSSSQYTDVTPRSSSQALEEPSQTGGGDAVALQPPFVVYGDCVTCIETCGNSMNCDATPAALERFGVLHGDRLVGVDGTAFEGRKATVLGVYTGWLVLLVDGEKGATVLRSVQEENKLLSLFTKICSPQPDNKIENETHVAKDKQSISSSPPDHKDGDDEYDDNGGNIGVEEEEEEEEEKYEDDDNDNDNDNENDDDDGEEDDGVIHPLASLDGAAAAAVTENCDREGLGRSEADISDRTSAPQSLFFTSFLKAVAYWRTHLLSEEDQRQQPLAFVNYYGTDTQRRMMEAVDLLQRHKNLFDLDDTDWSADTYLRLNASSCAAEKQPMSVHRIVQLLVENESN